MKPMQDLQLPPNHEPLPPNFLRQHGALKGMKCWYDQKWVEKVTDKPLVEMDFRLIWCAPTGTIAAATTPVPKVECSCGRNGFLSEVPADGPHHTSCPKHPRNAYVRILPHQLAQLPEKPEGLMIAHPKSGDWKLVNSNNFENQLDWIEWCMDGHFAYAVRRHVMDRIEQHLSTKGGDEPCATNTLAANAVNVEENAPSTVASNAAPESSDPTGEAAKPWLSKVLESVTVPTDTEMMDWWQQNGERAFRLTHGAWRVHWYPSRSDRIPTKSVEAHSFIAAITAAMKEDRK